MKKVLLTAAASGTQLASFSLPADFLAAGTAGQVAFLGFDSFAKVLDFVKKILK